METFCIAEASIRKASTSCPKRVPSKRKVALPRGATPLGETRMISNLAIRAQSREVDELVDMSDRLIKT